ncbi:two pore domain potassium channel family protein [Sphingomonas sinipercae]|uniref:Two pore domain potassium channel family protein n=1 Tax=Sphingomonas sinipercae TaxID=2714944 RepID=A0A6G7ZPV6_9SPHN|nr:two pore domain potassium channel family protein [Sphingomonas sinipercae]QIL02973.1 two pore domain potassium channel family protein [Sphingomonas sinipercae]
MEQEIVPMHLWTQLAVSAGFVLLMVLIHGLGLLGIGKIPTFEEKRLERHKMDFSALLMLASTGVLLFLLHFIEIFVFAVFYVVMETGVPTFADALYFSASAYATLGATEHVPERWRLIGAFEAVIGFVLIGWSTAFVARMMDKLQA